MTAVTVTHLVLDERGRAFINGTRTRGAMIVMDKMNGLAPEQIQSAYPYLSLAQVYAALAYYYDHKLEIDAEIAEETGALESARPRSGDQPTRADLETRVRDRQARP
jgi:uncharacterized protein (DUF433 family)